MNRIVVGAILAACTAGQAMAACGVESGSVRILANDCAAIDAVVAEAMDCEGPGVSVSANTTTEHKALQVPALTVDPARYSVAVVANNSLVPLMNAGLVRPLDDLVARYGGDLDAGQLVRVGGEIVAVAFMINAQHLYARGDLLDEVGLGVPGTYEEMLEAAEAIRAAGIMDYPLAAANAAGWNLGAEFVNMYLGMEGDFFAPGSAEPAIDDAAGLRALGMMRALTEYMAPDYMSLTPDEMRNRYVSGEVALMNQWGSMVQGIAGAEAISAEVAEATVLAPAPRVGGGATPAAALWWDGFALARNISDADAAASFRVMVHAIRAETAARNPDAAAWLVPGFEAPETARGVLDTAAAGARPYPVSPYMGLLFDAAATELTDYMQGSESAEQALRDVEAAYVTAAREAGFLN